MIGIVNLKEKCNISDETINKAVEVLKNIRGLGRNVRDISMNAVALYIAGILNNEFTPLDVILKYIPANKRECRVLLKRIKEANLYDLPKIIPLDRYIDYGFRVLGIKDEQLKNKIKKIIEENNLPPKPTSVAAVIYKVLNDKYGRRYTQPMICEVFNVSEVSIRNNLKKLKTEEE